MRVPERLEPLDDVRHRGHGQRRRRPDQRHLQHQPRVTRCGHLIGCLEEDLKDALKRGQGGACAHLLKRGGLGIRQLSGARALTADLHHDDVSDGAEQLAGEGSHVVAVVVNVGQDL